MHNRHKYRRAFLAAFPNTLPILTGFAFLGFAYGLLMSTSGYGPIWSFLMSSIAFCGSMQFVAITLLTSPFAPLQAFYMALMVNARHLFYGLSMLEKYKGIGRIKPFLIYVLCDETFSIVNSKEPPQGVDRAAFYFFVSFLDYSYWVIASTMGGLLGSAIQFNTKGLDFVLTALFVVIFLEQWLEGGNHFSASAGIASSIICLMLFGAGNFIIPSMLLLLLVLTFYRKYYKGEPSSCT
ncbi:4-azaleucine resistance probable transporter AzlC [Anaerocolumna jejuensis DSM 15929]|uniref:4-azaleucine resistance probable transporter AzlC n=1 Tax=Anaerocolumna jejuensis DSM 15929 TaxID=1121322 RepID=A0A1M6PKB0_9FIRM|nr:AzlC family ABC transporter permease [Anaerocolumna jejuensis]SHK08344.1 4-azaleucine resistance probable transporter AzlC [Anaerocolumna jejuensis DSM 15929]